MSHWSRGTGIIKDLVLLERVAKRMGVKVEDSTTFGSQWAGTAKCVKTLKAKGGVAGVVETSQKNEFQIQMDNYNNQLCGVIGASGSKLMHEYMVDKAREEALSMGGTVVSEQTDNLGYTELIVNVA